MQLIVLFIIREKHGSTRVPGHAFLAWRSSWRIVVCVHFLYNSWFSVFVYTESAHRRNSAAWHLNWYRLAISLAYPSREEGVNILVQMIFLPPFLRLEEGGGGVSIQRVEGLWMKRNGEKREYTQILWGTKLEVTVAWSRWKVHSILTC